MPKITRETHQIDASGKVVGRLASQIAILLMGKNKPTYMPNLDAGDIVVVTNADKLVFTGKKWSDKLYHRSSNRPSGITTLTAEQMKERDPGLVLQHAVKYMLPKNKLQTDRMKRLKIQ